MTAKWYLLSIIFSLLIEKPFYLLRPQSFSFQIAVRVYRLYVDMFLQRFYRAQKTKFSGHFWLGILIQDNLPVNLKQEVWPISQLLLGTGRRKRPVLSIEVVHPATCRLLLSLCLYARTRQTVLKVNRNLNKGASGSMKLNWWHATTNRQSGKNILDIILWSVSCFLQVISDWLM